MAKKMVSDEKSAGNRCALDNHAPTHTLVETRNFLTLNLELKISFINPIALDSAIRGGELLSMEKRDNEMTIGR